MLSIFVDTMANHLKSSLVSLGFSEKSAAVYLALAELGQASASDIARRCRLKRTTAYNILPELVAQGLVRATLNRGRREYFIEDTAELRRHFEVKLKTADTLLPALEQMQRRSSPATRLISYDGEQGVRSFFQDALRHLKRGDVLREIIGPQTFYSSLPKDIPATFVPERVRRGIHIKIIASPSEASLALAKKAAHELRQIRFTDDRMEGFHAATLLYANRVAYISMRRGFTGVCIEDETIASMQREIFDSLWEKLPRR